MDDQTKSDKLTETRGSFDEPSRWRKFYRFICPCLAFKKPVNQFIANNEQTKSSIKEQKSVTACFDGIDMKSENIEPGNLSFFGKNKKRKSSLYVSHLNRKRTLLQPYSDYLTKSTIQKWHSYPIYQYYKEKQIVAIGDKNSRLLALISSVRPLPSKSSENKTKRSVSNMKEIYQDDNSLTNVDRFWNQRYYLFEKFDEGISIDQESWNTVVPEAVAEFIASKIRCDTVLDAFCGVGGISIKLANTCYRVVANDKNRDRINCLSRNACVYSIDNIELVENNFLNMEDIQSDIVVLHPSIKVQKWQDKKCLRPDDLNPSLAEIMKKSITLSNNFVLLLPPNIDPNLVASCIAEAYRNSKQASATCSIKIQKIFFLSKMAYLAVFMGSQVQKQLKLNDELAYIYSLLKDEKKKVFTHRKIVKALRQKYGMINLLNYVLQSQEYQGDSPFEKFIRFIQDKELLDSYKLKKMMEDEEGERQRSESKRSPFLIEESQEEKYVGSQESERTVSYYSNTSGNRISILDPRSCISSTVSNNRLSLERKSSLGDNAPSSPTYKFKDTNSEIERNSDKDKYGSLSERIQVVEEQPPEREHELTKSALNSKVDSFSKDSSTRDDGSAS